MAAQTPLISLVVPTRGRTHQLTRLLDSLSLQDYENFDLLIVDQNEDDRLEEIVQQQRKFRARRIHCPGEQGSSRGRNIGWKAAQGKLIIFPDDDCWYPPWLLSRAASELNSLDADIVTGRAADMTGRSINGRYLLERQKINRANVWLAGIEWMMLFRRATLVELNGFDENIGVGARSLWQACEGQDILLRAIGAGKTCYFDPTLFGHHEELDVVTPDKNMVSKGRMYGRGLGYVLRIHHFPITTFLMWMGRPLLRLTSDLLKGNIKTVSYLLNVSIGRLEGYLGREVMGFRN